MENILLKLAERVEAREIIYFLIIICLFGVIVFQEFSLRKKDKLFSKMINDLIFEINQNGNQLTQLTSIVNFLAFSNKKISSDEN